MFWFARATISERWTGLKDAKSDMPAEQIEQLFASIEPVFVDLATGREVDEGDPETYDQQKAKKDPEVNAADSAYPQKRRERINSG